MIQKLISVDSMDEALALFGDYDDNINLIQRRYGVVILCRGTDITVSGEEKNVEDASECIDSLLSLVKKGERITSQNLSYIFSLVEEGEADKVPSLSEGGICVTVSGKIVKPKTLGQKRYVDAIRNNTVTIGIGPDPYLRPLYDALFEMLGAESFARQQEKGAIEVAPLAYMRGRTLDDSYIILDEAQNTTPEQMKMFLTRLGFGSKIVITGDVTQIDLPDKRRSGLVEAVKVLKNVEDISINRFTEKDVVRHKLVSDIIKAYEKYNNERKS